MPIKYKLLIALIGISAIVYFSPIPVSQTESISVHISYDKLLNELSDLHYWKAWWPDSAGTFIIGDTIFRTPSDMYVLEKKESLGVIVSQYDKSLYHFIIVQPNDKNGTSTIYWKQVRYLRTAIKQRIRTLFGRSSYTLPFLLQHIKKYAEDPSKLYGYNIKIEPVVDTFVLVTRVTGLKINIPAALKTMFASLQQQLNLSHYAGRAEKMYFIDSTSSDSIKIMAGISIEKELAAAAPFSMMRMPKAHIITGEYEGDYKNIGLVHKAMDRYASDYHIGRAAVPYEKIYAVAQTAQDSQHVKIKVYHPSMIP